MGRFRRIWNVARVELRAQLRSWRYWLLILIFLGCVGVFLTLQAQPILSHGYILLGSTRYAAMPAMAAGYPLMLISMLIGAGAIERERAAGAFEVIGTKPISAVQYTLGKWLALFLCLAVPGIVPVACGAIVQQVADAGPLDWFPFVLWGTLAVIVPLVLGLSLSLLFGTAGRGTTVALGVWLLLVIGAGNALSILKFHSDVDLAALLWPVLLNRGFDFSDIAPFTSDVGQLLSRTAVYLSTAVLGIALTALYVKPMQPDRRPRVVQPDAKLRDLLRLWLVARDNLLPDRRVGRWALGGLLIVAVVWGYSLFDYGQREWRKQTNAVLHAEATELAREQLVDEPVARPVAYELDVRLMPRRSRLQVDAKIELLNPHPVALRTLAMHLRPNLVVEQVLDQGRQVRAVFRQGELLQVETAEVLAPGASTTLRLRYAGRDPDNILPGFVHYAADEAWYPIFAGWRVAGRLEPDGFFASDVHVELPATLVPLSQGSAEPLGTSAGRTRWRFGSGAQRFTGLSLIAGAFSRDEDLQGKLPITWYTDPRYATGLPELREAMQGLVEQLYGESMIPPPYAELAAVQLPDQFWSTNLWHPGFQIVFESNLKVRRTAEHPWGPYSPFKAIHQLLGYRSLSPGIVTATLHPRGPGGELLTVGLERFCRATLRQRLGAGNLPGALTANLTKRGLRNDRQAIRKRPELVADQDPNYTAWVEQVGPKIWAALEHLVGSDRFWPAMREFIEAHRYGSGELSDLESLLSQAAGRDLGWFFTEYVKGKAIPEYELVRAAAVREGDRYRLDVRVRNIGTGQMPVPLVVVARGTSLREELWIGDGETIDHTVWIEHEPVLVRLDPLAQLFRIGGGLESRVQLESAS